MFDGTASPDKVKLDQGSTGTNSSTNPSVSSSDWLITESFDIPTSINYRGTARQLVANIACSNSYNGQSSDTIEIFIRLKGSSSKLYEENANAGKIGSTSLSGKSFSKGQMGSVTVTYTVPTTFTTGTYFVGARLIYSAQGKTNYSIEDTAGGNGGVMSVQ